jgi:hypothetical protein
MPLVDNIDTNIRFVTDEKKMERAVGEAFGRFYTPKENKIDVSFYGLVFFLLLEYFFKFRVNSSLFLTKKWLLGRYQVFLKDEAKTFLYLLLLIDFNLKNIQRCGTE